ncbi:MAG TPA: TIGR03545 family protein [Treponemataceae bacterium]|nr:TIGR03545 family protein [Treponemataceae bacterium]
MSEDKKIKKTKKVKQPKTFSIKKLPAFYKKKKNLKKIEKKIFKGLHIANDESFVRSLYMQKDGQYFLIEDKSFTKKDIARLKKIAKDIKSQKAFRINLLPLAISLACIFALVLSVITFKDLVLKIAVQKIGESIFQAKCDIDYAKIELINAHIRLDGIQQADKNAPMKNLFEIDRIDIDFDLLQLLKKKFVSENIEVRNIAFGTDRKSSGFIPQKEKKQKEKKEGDGFDFNSLLSLPIIQDEKNDIIESLSSFNPETILSNLNDSLRSPDLAKTVIDDVELLYRKYEKLPNEFEIASKDVQEKIKEIQAIDIEELKKNPTKIPEAISLVQSSLDLTKEIKTKIDKTSSELQGDVKKVSAYSKEIQTAFNADLTFVSKEINSLTSFRLGDAKTIMTDELEKIAIRSLGKYYPYAVLGLEKVKEFSTKPKKEVKPKKEKKRIIRTGRIITYKKDTKPSILLQNIHLSSLVSDWDISADIKDISNDMDLWGRPTSAEFIFDTSSIKNFGSLVFDLRESRENLIAVQYDGSGYPMDLSKISQSLMEGAESQKLSIPGLPLISGTSKIQSKLVADDFNVFAIEGSLLLDPCSVQSASFEPEFVYNLYARALQKLNSLDASFKIQNTKDAGFDLKISSDIDAQFIEIFSELMNEEITSIQQAATKEVEAFLRESLAPVYDAIGEFNSIDELIENQKKKLEGYQKEAEKKISELKQIASNRLEEEKQKALEEAQKIIDKGKEEAQKEVDKAKEQGKEVVEDAVKNVLKGFF